MVRLTTALLQMLFGLHQTYSEAREIPGDVILELLEAKLDEGLSYLEGDGPRLARKQIEVTKAFGSVGAFVEEAKKEQRDAPDLPPMPA